MKRNGFFQTNVFWNVLASLLLVLLEGIDPGAFSRPQNYASRCPCPCRGAHPAPRNGNSSVAVPPDLGDSDISASAAPSRGWLETSDPPPRSPPGYAYPRFGSISWHAGGFSRIRGIERPRKYRALRGGRPRSGQRTGLEARTAMFFATSATLVYLLGEVESMERVVSSLAVSAKRLVSHLAYLAERVI